MVVVGVVGPWCVTFYDRRQDWFWGKKKKRRSKKKKRERENTLINIIWSTLKYLHLQEKTFNGCIFIFKYFVPIDGFFIIGWILKYNHILSGGYNTYNTSELDFLACSLNRIGLGLD